MSDLMSIGTSGVRAYQTALATTSENIANAATPGYSRRSVQLTEVAKAGVAGLGQNAVLYGFGARVAGVSRASDEFRASEARSSGSDVARTEAGVAWIDRIEGALSGNQLTDRLNTFFATAKTVAADPAATAPRTVMLEDARSLAAGFASTGRALTAAADELDGKGKDIAAQLTELSRGIARINQGLTRAADGSAAQAQLLDERDRTLESMSALVDVNVKLDEAGRATVRAGGANGPIIADVENGSLISFASNTSGTVVVSVSRGGSMDTISPNGGALAGLSDGALRIAGAREDLDKIAKSFVKEMNDWQAGGKTLAGTPGTAMFEVATGAPATEISVKLTDPSGIAAAYGASEGPRGNGNMTRLTALRVSAGWENDFDDMTTSNAALLVTRKTVATAQGAIHSTALAARDGVVGVDLDEEAVNLIRFQQAYQASSRVIQVARDILQTIIDIR
ncbi:flagellar hook-associated protein FlgK [Sphingomonas floccifaciens]|uniref:Flagellar hook-associated protein 1 n=1 Tax=Sphingomonas floccifaciens TaxID=1844115 RepID=A0ABW4N9W3_9SPHN